SNISCDLGFWPTANIRSSERRGAGLASRPCSAAEAERRSIKLSQPFELCLPIVRVFKAPPRQSAGLACSLVIQQIFLDDALELLHAAIANHVKEWIGVVNCLHFRQVIRDTRETRGPVFSKTHRKCTVVLSVGRSDRDAEPCARQYGG